MSEPLSLIVPLALDLLVENVNENTGDRFVIVRTLLDTEARTPLKVSLMKRSKCAAIVSFVSAGENALADRRPAYRKEG